MNEWDKEIEFLRGQLAALQMEQKLIASQMAKAIEMVADSKNAVIIAQHAQAMASEALIKATTGKTMDEALGIDSTPSPRGNIVSLDDRKGSRMNYFDDLMVDIPELKGE